MKDRSGTRDKKWRMRSRRRKDMTKVSAAGETKKDRVQQEKQGITTEEMEWEGKGDLNHNPLLNFTRSCFTKDPRAGPTSWALPHTFNKLRELLCLLWVCVCVCVHKWLTAFRACKEKKRNVCNRGHIYRKGQNNLICRQWTGSRKGMTMSPDISGGLVGQLTKSDTNKISI